MTTQQNVLYVCCIDKYSHSLQINIQLLTRGAEHLLWHMFYIKRVLQVLLL